MAEVEHCSITRSTSVINGQKREAVRVQYDGHVLEAVELDMADQWDFMEMAGSQIDNEAWTNTALLASSVISIDGIPQPTGVKTRDAIRVILRKIGVRGLEALNTAFAEEAENVSAASAQEKAICAGN